MADLDLIKVVQPSDNDYQIQEQAFDHMAQTSFQYSHKSTVFLMVNENFVEYNKAQWQSIVDYFNLEQLSWHDETLVIMKDPHKDNRILITKDELHYLVLNITEDRFYSE